MKWLCLILLGCTAAVAQTPVILISIDTLRADHLGVYGYREGATPNIDAFAAQSTVFMQVSAQVPLTLPSHTTLLTSTYPFQNRVEENGQVVPARAVTLASVLKSHGYKTGAFIGSVILDKEAGLARGFDEYDSPFNAGGSNPQNPYSSRVRRDGALVLRAATQWINAHDGQPYFAFIHLFDLHAPYKVLPGRGTALPEKSGYDAEIRYVDQVLARFLHSPAVRDSLVVLVSDHGESLGDHGETSHGFFAYESTLHVPMIIHWPASSGDHSPRVTGAAGLIDVAPTILDALHLPPESSFEGVGLLKTGDAEMHPVYAGSMYPRDQFGWAPIRTLRIGDWKLIDTQRAELYDLSKDPAESTNRIRTNAAQATTLRAEMARLLNRYKPQAQPQVQSSAGNALRSLGYLSGGPGSGPATTASDPKDRIAEYELFEKSLDAYYGGRIPAAIAGLRHVLALDRNNRPAANALKEFETTRKR